MNIRLILRFAEALTLFVVLPLMVYWNLFPIPKIAALLVVTIGCILFLWADGSYVMRRLSYRPHIPGLWKRIIIRSALVAVSLIALVLFLQPEQLFAFPKERPVTWGIVIVLYPVLSALPQELIYREFIFHRYNQLLGTGWLMVAVSATAFSFLHIIYDNNYAIILSLIGGFMFARTYRQTRSLYWVSIEHAIYGCLIFTVGMGNYFYESF